MARQPRRRSAGGFQNRCRQCWLPLFLLVVAVSSWVFWNLKLQLKRAKLNTPAEFSLWAMPAKDSPFRRRLQDMIDTLSNEFGSPGFEPHVTLIGLIGSPQGLTEKEVRERSEILARNLRPYSLKAMYVSSGSTYYQCVYILMKKTSDAMLANMRARLLFGQETWEGDWQEDSPRMFAHANSSGYMPHLSLLYSDMSAERARRVAAKVAARTGTLVGETEFEVTSLSLYRTASADRDLLTWHLVAEYPLSVLP